jgi:iron complex outermembrane receptor protein
VRQPRYATQLVCACILLLTAPFAAAQTAGTPPPDVRIEAGELADALAIYIRQTNVQLIYRLEQVRGLRTEGSDGADTLEAVLDELLQGTGLVLSRDPSGAMAIIVPKAPESGASLDGAAATSAIASAADAASLAGGAPSDSSLADVAQNLSGESTTTSVATVRTQGIEEIIVTAQKREERLLDVPIAMTALSAEALDEFKIEGGSELLRAIPNVNFSKSNFSMYNFSIRGVGTKAVSAASDPAVAVSFNNTALVRNRLFESEFMDMARVEVLRGPQGTLYGRNATAGVVNLIPALPDSTLGGELKIEGGNYDTQRASGMINVPIGDHFGVRAAAAWTKRDGYDYNTYTQKDVNGRDLWSGRLSAAWQPTDWLNANVIWQHFEEDDDRSRTGKQLCTKDDGPARVGTTAVPDLYVRARLSQGCKPGSLYADAAYGTPNGRSLTFVTTAGSNSFGYSWDGQTPIVRGEIVNLFKGGTPADPGDPFAGVTQSRNLREIATSYDPVFEAKNDVVQFNLTLDMTDQLQFVSQSTYAEDHYYSSQDYNRFVSTLTFNDTALPRVDILRRLIDVENFPGATPGGIYCDPQLGCSDRMLSVDISRSRNQQYSQEFRLQSAFEGPLNFSLGLNYMDFETKDDYYVFNNLFTIIADWTYNRAPPVPDRNPQLRNPPCVLGFEDRECPYVDRNPLNQIDNQGHNYFLSQNGVKIKSQAAFGELYWKMADDVKLTVGVRYTTDKKVSDQIPSQLLLAGGTANPSGEIFIGDITGGRVNSGYPSLPEIRQEWNEFTGRAVLDWQPDLSFTDDTLVYFSMARGYKGGGTNPPRVDFNPRVVQYQFLPETFKPEYVNAFELGTKNSFGGGRYMVNANVFLYDYSDYQVSQIMDRIAFNENFDSINWGIELETAWRPTRAVRIDANLGYLRTRLANGSESIDIMDRTQGNPDWVLLRPWIQVPSNCIAPRVFVEKLLQATAPGIVDLAALCPGADRVGTYDPASTSRFHKEGIYGFTYNPLLPYDPATVGMNIDQGGSGAPNGGRGFNADLSGNNLPNAPRWTFNFGAQYTFFIREWNLTTRGDYYWQDESHARVYNTKFDELRAWDNVNFAVTLDQPRLGLTVQAYVKNAFDKTPITDTFVNSDDTGLTTNVFTLDPRLFGLSVRKTF